MCETQIKSSIKSNIQPFGFIYLSTNTINRKVYVGLTKFPRAIEDRWHEHLLEGRKLRREREANPDKKINDTHLNNALAKYDESVWHLSQIDVAFSLEELNEKERYWIKVFDSMNPKKGYNMKEGGAGGRHRPEVKEKVSNGVKAKWQEEEYIERQRKAMEKKQNSSKYKEILRKAHLKISKLIKNKEKFLNDIKEGMSLQELIDKYNMSHPTLLKNIQMLLGKFGVKDYRQAKRFLNKREFLLDIRNGILAKEIRKKHKTNNRGFSRMIREYLGCYGITTYVEAKKFLKNKKLGEILIKNEKS